MTDRMSWAIKDESILTDLVTLMDLTDHERHLLATLQPQAKTHAPELAEAFYQRITLNDKAAEYVVGQVDHLKGTLQDWFIELFSGEYGTEYVRRRLKIGQVHVRIGLPVRYPLAMIDVILAVGQKVTAQNPDAQAAFHKLLALDMAIFNQAYEDTQLKHLVHMVGNERLARRMLSQ